MDSTCPVTTCSRRLYTILPIKGVQQNLNTCSVQLNVQSTSNLGILWYSKEYAALVVQCGATSGDTFTTCT